MAKQISSLSIALFASAGPLVAGFKQAEHAADSFIGKAGEIGSKMLELTGVVGGIAGILGGAFEIGKGFKIAAELETAQVQFTALTGSAETAHSTLEQLKDFAAKSPFTFPELTEASKKLIAVGVAADGVPSLLKEIGDVAAGTGAPIGEIAGIFTRVAEEGTLTSKSITKLGKDGIPLMDALAKSLGTTGAGVKEMADNGQIGFNQLVGAFDQLTAKGGKFNGIVAAQSQTIGGRWKTLTTSMEEGMGDIAESLINAFDLRGLLATASGVFSSLTTYISGFITTAAPYIIRFGQGVVSTFEGIYTAAQPILARVWGVVSSVFSGIVGVVTTAGPAVWGAVQAAFNGVVSFVGPIFTALYETVAENWQAIIGCTVEVGTSLYGVVSSIFGAVWSVAQTVWNGITAVFTWGWDLVAGKSKTSGERAAGAFNGVVAAGKWVADTLSTTFTIASYVIDHFGDVAQLVCVGTMARIVTLANQTQYFFGTAVPAVLVWFGNNWKEIFTDAFNFTATTMGNLASNVVNVIKNVPKLISGDATFAGLWTPLTDGFRATLSELPNIPAREKGALENALDAEVKGLQNKVGDGLGEALIKQQSMADKATKAVVKTIETGLHPKIKPIVPEITKPEVPQPDPVKIKAHLDPSAMTATVSVKVERAKSILSGSAESMALRYADHSSPLAVPSMARPAQAPVTPSAGAAAQSERTPSPSVAAALPVPTAQTPFINPAALVTPQSFLPPLPNVPGAKTATEQVNKQIEQNQLEQQKLMVQWLLRIEQNTRPTNQNFVTI